VGLALLAILKNHKVSISAICSSFGATSLANSSANIFRTLSAAKRKERVPIYPGALYKLMGVKEEEFAEEKTDVISPKRLGKEKVENKLEKRHASIGIIDALIKTEKKKSNTVAFPKTTYLCLGPLTNLALALKLDPSIVQKIKKLVIFGGSTSKFSVSVNFNHDPESAKLVLDTFSYHDVEIQIICSDIGMHNAFNANFYSSIQSCLSGQPFREYLNMLLEEFKPTSEENFFCPSEFMAACISINSKVVVDSKKCMVDIETGGSTKGEIILRKGDEDANVVMPLLFDQSTLLQMLRLALK